LGETYKYKELFRLFLIVILFSGLITITFSDTVPKSETIVIPGELNDSKQNAQVFDSASEYVYGNESTQSESIQSSSSRTMSAMTIASPSTLLPAWRKTSFTTPGTLVVTLSYEKDSNYSIEVYNSCSNNNFCQEYEFGITKTCVMNIQPGDYYFKVINIKGNSKYYLDVDLIENKQLSKINASDCNTTNACLKNTDCGTSGFTGERYCKDNSVYQKYNNFVCNNPATTSAKCNNNIEEKLIEKCSSCSNGACISNTPTLTCPTDMVSDTFTFTGSAGKYTNKIYLQIGDTNSLTNSVKIPVTNLNAISIKSYYKTLLGYTTKNRFARIYGENASGKKAYSNICKFKLTPPTPPTITCPTEAIDENHLFSWGKGSNTEMSLKIGSDANFKEFFKIETKSTNPTPIRNYFRNIVDYEIKNPEKKVYTTMVGVDKYGRKTTSQVCTVSLKQPIAPTLECPTSPISKLYAFKWGNGNNRKTLIEFAYNKNFTEKTSVNTAKISPFKVSEYFSTLKAYANKNANKYVFARVYSVDKYKKVYSNICKFNISGIKALENGSNINVLSFASITSSQSSQAQSNITETPVESTNELGETEQGMIYTINSNSTISSSPLMATSMVAASTIAGCTFKYTEKTNCDSQWEFYQIQFNSTTQNKAQYRFVDCTTGQTVSTGQICSGQQSEKNYRPAGHSVKFELDYYSCTNGECSSGTTCTSGWKCKDSQTKAYQNTDCSWTSQTYCDNRCSNGTCNSTTTPVDCENPDFEGYVSCSSCLRIGASGALDEIDLTKIQITEPGTLVATLINNTTEDLDLKISSSCNSVPLCNSSGSDSNKTCIKQVNPGTYYATINSNNSSVDYYAKYCLNCSSNTECISHNTSKCYNNNVYWYNSCNQLEELKQNCNGLGCSDGSCNSAPTNGTTGFCTLGKPCQAGQGNCTKNQECQTGLICVEGVGSQYGFESNVNVCQKQPTAYTLINSTKYNTNTFEINIQNGNVVSTQIFAKDYTPLNSSAAFFGSPMDYKIWTSGKIEDHAFDGAYCLTAEEQKQPIPHINLHISKSGTEIQNWHFGYLKEDEKKCIIVFERVSGLAPTWCEKICGDDPKMRDIIRGAPYSVPIPPEAFDKIENFYNSYYPSWIDGGYYTIIIGGVSIGVAVTVVATQLMPCIFTLGLFCPAA
jgi:hypothetical protein